ncbi:MAG: DNA polymerase III subunit gamma/tau [Sphingomonadales bacterium]
MTDNPQSGDSRSKAIEATPDYRVLARKYRPGKFDELIGQQAMVRTLSNAIANDRLAHAFILTGVRGVGKTTTARLIARALNCTGDGDGDKPTINPCGECQSCRAIAESRDVDVLEMDAASHTGVDDIREIIDAARYAPVSSRYKVYIIDEVHMLSRSAFNALLKTLEEPPTHVKFVFATTEIRKVPVTVLSRCQRFDLRRVASATLLEHFQGIAATERAEVEPEALGLIVRSAEGSVRDGLSLLDQAIAHGAGKVTEAQVSAMLGLADRMRVFDLHEAVMSGNIAGALDQLADLYDTGADPAVIVQDLLEITHWLTRLKAAPGAAFDVSVSEVQLTRGREMADRLSMAVLARCWQMLLKGIDETRRAPIPLSAAEMVLVRLAYVSDLPTPGELVRKLSGQQREGQSAPDAPPATPSTPGGAYSTAPGATPGSTTAAMPQISPAPQTPVAPRPTSFEQVVELAAAKNELVLYSNLVDNVRLVSFQPRRLEISLNPKAPSDIANNLSQGLRQWTGERWVVTVSSAKGGQTLKEQRGAARARLIAEASQAPLVKAVLAHFPGAEITEVRDRPGRRDDTVTPFERRSKEEQE